MQLVTPLYDMQSEASAAKEIGDGSEELLEPFRPRNVGAGKCTMYRRGSVIVISSLDDADIGLLEGFKPRGQEDDDTSFETSRGNDMKNSNPAVSPPVPSSGVVDAGKTTFRSTLGYLWQSIPSGPQWSPAKAVELPRQQSKLEIECEEWKESRFKQIMQTVQDSEDFRQLKREMRSSALVMGAHGALTQVVQKKMEENTTARKTRRRSNSFHGFPARGVFSTEGKSDSLGGSISDFHVNLSPFATDSDD